MVGSGIGRSLVALPGLLASIAVGLIVAGLTRGLALAAGTTVLLAVLVVARAATVGAVIDLDRQQLVLRTFWRSHTIGSQDLWRVEGRSRGEGWPPGVRFVTTDRREVSTLALCYLDEEPAERLIEQLRAFAGGETELDVAPSSFRPRL